MRADLKSFLCLSRSDTRLSERSQLSSKWKPFIFGCWIYRIILSCINNVPYMIMYQPDNRMVSDIDVLMAEPAPMDRLRAYDGCRVRHLLGKCRGEIRYDVALDREERSGSF